MDNVVVIGAGVVGAACAWYATQAGLHVTVVDSNTIAGGTTSRGEGNILVSDKEPGPELDLALASRQLWLELGDCLGADRLELARKGGLVVAHDPLALDSLHDFAKSQSRSGIELETVDAQNLSELEPRLSPNLAGGVNYPQDLQVQPALAAAALVTDARDRGANILTGVEVTGLSSGSVITLHTDNGPIATDAVINAAGTWGGQLSERLGGPIPVLPRKGYVLVTEPLPRVVRRKVYTAGYVDNVASDTAGLETSTVVEGTRGGTLLIGASRERVGFDTTMSPDIVAILARQAISVFPFLEHIRLLRTYTGFRPFCPDHLPVIGPDPRVPGLYHACGHEGAGIGLAPVTGQVIAAQLTGSEMPVDARAFAPDRFGLAA